MDSAQLSNIETDLFLKTLRERYGYDFNDYAKASMRRRVRALASAHNFGCISELIPWVLSHPNAIDEVLARLSVPVTEMFRDPEVFLYLREHVIPELAIHPVINVWQSGSASGEEAYSLAILFKECGLADRVRIYATDINGSALQRAEEAVYQLDSFRRYSGNYLQAGGVASLSDYFHIRYSLAKLNDDIRKMVYFAHHNLVTDGSFNEFHIIFCRNVLIYFNADLQRRVLQLFCDSLAWDGVLCLGPRESIRDRQLRERFQAIHDDHRIYRYLNNAQG